MFIKRDIPKKFSNQFASWFSNTCRNGVKHPVYGSHQVTPEQIKKSSGEYKSALYKEIKGALEREPDNKSLWDRLGLKDKKVELQVNLHYSEDMISASGLLDSDMKVLIANNFPDLLRQVRALDIKVENLVLTFQPED